MGGCRTCGGGYNYSQHHPIDKKCHCHEIKSDCGCKIELGTECVRWEDKNIPYLDVKTNERLTSVIHKLSNRIHELEQSLKFIPKLERFQIEGGTIRTSSPFDIRTLKVFNNGVLIDETEYEIYDNETIRFTSLGRAGEKIVVDYNKIEGGEIQGLPNEEEVIKK